MATRGGRSQLNIRCAAGQIEAWQRASAADDREYSDWVRRTLDRAAGLTAAEPRRPTEPEEARAIALAFGWLLDHEPEVADAVLSVVAAVRSSDVWRPAVLGLAHSLRDAQTRPRAARREPSRDRSR